MEIAVFGTGSVGSTLGRRLALVGHQVTFGSRAPQSDRVQALVQENQNAHTATDLPSAAAAADVIVLAAPWPAVEEVLESAGDLTGKVLIDCTNPLNETFDGLELGYHESAAERIAEWAPGARVVKAFNTVSVSTMSEPAYDGVRASLFYCGDDPRAKQTTARLIEQLGMEPVDCGPLQNARYLEPMAMLYIHLAVHEGWGGNCALKMLTR